MICDDILNNVKKNHYITHTHTHTPDAAGGGPVRFSRFRWWFGRLFLCFLWVCVRFLKAPRWVLFSFLSLVLFKVVFEVCASLKKLCLNVYFVDILSVPVIFSSILCY